jgi:hypothetical protein
MPRRSCARFNTSSLPICHKLPLPLPRFITIPQSSISHTEFGIRNSEIRNANAPIPHHGAGSSGPIIPGVNGAAEWSGFGPSISSPANPAYRPSTLPAPSDALVAHFRSSAGHSHSSTQPPLRTSAPPQQPLPHFQVSQSGIGGSQKLPPSAGRLKTPPQRLGDAIFDSLLREY